jgi:hypothetical protein
VVLDGTAGVMSAVAAGALSGVAIWGWRPDRLAQATTSLEPCWTEQDVDEALALTAYREGLAADEAERQAGLCPCGCGQPVAETTAHYTEGPEYDATSITCRARAALNEAQDALAERNKGGGGKDPRALVWRIHKLNGG